MRVGFAFNAHLFYFVSEQQNQKLKISTTSMARKVFGVKLKDELVRMEGEVSALSLF
ncbi:hypothetical protein BH24ACI1_BH24ACI1_12520 [soil metagenome]|jgi:hypothetical protein